MPKASKPVRIVAVGDTHTYQEDCRVPEGDIFVHVGDLCRKGAMHELEDAATWIRSLTHRHKVIVAGNHDWPFVLDPREARALFKGMTYLQDDSTTLAGVRFYGSPWQPEFFAWAFNLPRGGKGLQQVWDNIPSGLDVLITHGPPHGYGDLCRAGDRAGCELLLRRIREAKPKLHLFGHIHCDGGSWQDGQTALVNVTSNECRRAPTVIDYDPRTKTVTFVSVPPARKY